MLDSLKRRLRALLPDPERLQQNRWLRWLGPALQRRHLWHFSRKGVALGVALGVFFGLLIPVAQIPAAATGAVVLRANLPMAVASTLVTNPVTFAPVYLAAYQIGRLVLGEDAAPAAQDDAARAPAVLATEPAQDASWLARLGSVGKPLVVGLGILAVGCGALVYVLISAGWALRVRWKRRRQLRQRQAR
ncbi:DUF2062 domain-containing protein [Hydrogenophaga sp.]|uniref:DUF2062 domain-containing protein n=1 Tax=Hydrogenophaga sp. TaxID=1904254 RepID=UPI0035AD877D